MALINCPECGEKVSDTCECCIHCGYKLSSGDGDYKKPEIVAYRGEEKGAAGGCVFGFVCAGALFAFATILFLNWFILSDFQTANPMAQFICVIVQMVLWGLCIGCVAGNVIGLVRYKRNARVQNECIVYYQEQGKLVLTTLDNRRIEIKPFQFVESSSTNHFLTV